jgi:hypothetical protein
MKPVNKVTAITFQMLRNGGLNLGYLKQDIHLKKNMVVILRRKFIQNIFRIAKIVQQAATSP